MKYEFAVISTEGETGDLPMPISMDKLREVAEGIGHFSCAQDVEIAKWMLQINQIMIMR